MHQNLTVWFPNIVLASRYFVLMGTGAKFSTGMINKRKVFFVSKEGYFLRKDNKKKRLLIFYIYK